MIGSSQNDMLSSKFKDLRERKTFFNLEKSKLIDKFVFLNLLNRSDTVKKLAFFRLFCSNLKKSSKVKVIRRCIFTNRSRSVIRPFGVSRTHLRELMQFGIVPGYSKAVW